MTDVEAAREGLRREAKTYGRKLGVNPYSALLEEVKWRAGHVESLRTEIQNQPNFESLLVWDHNGNQREGPLLKRYDSERDRLDRACKLAIDSGIAERYVVLAELHGRVLFEVLREALSDPAVALSEPQRRALVEAMKRAVASQQQARALDAQAEEAPR